MNSKNNSKLKMSKAKGYTILLSLIFGLMLLWVSISSITIFAVALACISFAIWLYHSHVKSGGITIQEAWEEGNKNKGKITK